MKRLVSPKRANKAKPDMTAKEIADERAAKYALANKKLNYDSIELHKLEAVIVKKEGVQEYKKVNKKIMMMKFARSIKDKM